MPNSGVPALERLDYRVNSWDVDFLHYIKEDLEVKYKKPVILCGDLNVAFQEIDIYKSDKAHMKQAGFTSKERNSFANFLEKTGFVDTYRHQNPGKVQYSFWSIR